MAAKTGNRWPVVGVRLHPEYPYLEAEVRYVEIKVKKYWWKEHGMGLSGKDVSGQGTQFGVSSPKRAK